MIRTSISKAGRFARRVTALILCVIMIAMMLPFGVLFSASAATDDAIFVFTNKKGAGVSGISITIEEIDTTQESDNNGKVYFNDLVEGTEYNYSVDVESDYLAIVDGSFTFEAADDPIPVTVYAKTPVITEEPISQTIAYGGTASFSVAATGLGTLSYKWLKGGTAIVNETEATLEISPVTAGGVYSCSVTSDLAQEGSNTATSDPATLTVENAAPTITTQPEDLSKLYGETASFSVEANGLGELSYQWLKYDSILEVSAPITGETDATLTISSVITDGKYSCAVTSTFGDDSKTTTSNEVTLTVGKATPAISIVASPPSPITYNGNETTITATITSPANVAKPTGKVEFYVDNNETPKTIITIDAHYNPTSYSLVLTSDTVHSIRVKYVGDVNYNDADATISYTVGKVTPVQDRDYAVNTPNGTILNPPEPDLFGWYKTGDQLEITPTPKGLFDQISESKDRGWNTSLITTNETLATGTQVTFYLRNSITGEVSNSKIITYKLDSTAPAIDKMTFAGFGAWFDGKFNYTLSFKTDVSGIAQYRWRYRNEPNTWHTGTLDNEGKAYVSLGWNRTGIVVDAIDNAGNGYNLANEKKMSNDRIVDISYPTAVDMVDENNVTVNSADADTRFIHNPVDNPVDKTLTGTLSVSNDAFAPEGIMITATKDGGPTEIIGWTETEKGSGIWTTDSGWAETEEDSGIWVTDFSVSGDGVYVFSISLVGYHFQSSEFGANTGENSYTSNPHIIDTTAPIISFAYVPEALTGGWTVFGDARKAIISVKDKNFRSDELSFSSFLAVDSENNTIENPENAVRDSLLDALKKATWGKKGDTYSAEITFSVEANYKFVLSYTDIAGNQGQSAEQAFAIDKTAPTELKVKYHTNPISTLVSALTFGYYNPSVTIELIADDATSDIEYFSWTYTREADVSTTLNKESEENAHLDAVNNSTKTSTAQFTLTADEFAQYRGTISFTATDKAGNVSVLYNGPMVDNNDEHPDVDVLVIDTLPPTRVVTYTTPTQIRDKDLALFTGDDVAKVVRVNDEEQNDKSILYYTDSVTATIQVDEANFYEEDVIVKVNGVLYTNAAWTKTPYSDLWTGTVIIAEAGAHVITVEYIDKSGNVMKPYQSSTIYIDGTAPTIDSVNFAPKAADEVEKTSSFIEVLEYGFYFKTEFIATINVYDATPSSGLDEISYRLVPYVNGAPQTETQGTAKITDNPDTPDINDAIAKISIPAEFKGQIFVEAFDNTRNTSGEKTTQAYVIDNTAPTITVVDDNTTTYTDAAGNMLFVTDTSVTVTITDIVPGDKDTVSGIKEIGYAQSSEKGTYARKFIQINNAGYTVNQNLGDGWIVAEMDKNLVTKVTKTFMFNSDDNDIVLTFDAKDRSENQTSPKVSSTFTVDKTDPIINIIFQEDDDSDVYYSENRIADITVIERNIDPNLIKAAIENKIGAAPGFTFTDVSNTEHTAVINFFEGDYTFEMSGTDLGGRTATVNYAGGNENMFFVDNTNPTIENNFITFSNAPTKDSFKVDKTAMITINEHNFDPALTNLKIFRKAAGADQNNIGFADVTQQLLNGIRWTDNGDLRTIKFTVSSDAVYQIEIAPVDLSGRAADFGNFPRNTVVFEIDKTIPKLTAPDDQTAKVYTLPANEEPSVAVEFADSNIKEIRYSITNCTYTKEDDIAYKLEDKKLDSLSVPGSKVNLPSEHFEKDGIYELRATAYDDAGNDSGEKVYTYVVMRNTAVLAYIPKDDLVKFHNIGKRAVDFEAIPIRIYTANEANEENKNDFNLKIGETLLINGDYITENKPDEQPFLNQVKEYQLTIPQIYIANTFNEDAQVYDMPVNALNKNGQILTLGQMVIDNVKPFGEFEEGLKNGKGFYNVSSKEIKVVKLSDDIDKDKTTVIVDGQVAEFSYDAVGKTMSFTLDKSSAYGHPWNGHNIKVKLVDTAGNEYPVPEISNVYVGNWFYRYWSFFTVGGVAVIVGGLLWWKPWRKKED